MRSANKIGLMLTIGAVAFGGGLLVGGFAGCMVRTQMPKFGSTASQKQMTRDEFRKLVMGKTKDEVIAAVGKPEFTSKRSDTDEFWNYADLVTDPISGNLDWRTTVNFKNGVVVSTDP